jgi:hypothetical protein
MFQLVIIYLVLNYDKAHFYFYFLIHVDVGWGKE